MTIKELFNSLFGNKENNDQDIKQQQTILNKPLLRIYICRSDGFIQVFKYVIFQIKIKENQLKAIAQLVSPNNNNEYPFLKKVIIVNLADINKTKTLYLSNNNIGSIDDLKNLYFNITMTINKKLFRKEIDNLFIKLNKKLNNVFAKQTKEIKKKILFN